MAIAKIKVVSSPSVEERSLELVQLGFSSYDAAHIASAERSNADVFLSVDDRLIRKAQRNFEAIYVAVDNPINWLIKSTTIEDNEND